MAQHSRLYLEHPQGGYMKKFLLAVSFLTACFALTARAQIIDGVYNTVTAPMDKVAGEHTTYYANVAAAGAAEEAKGQNQRYYEMIVPINKAIDRHFELLTDQEKLLENTPQKRSGK
jgi:hypothetical protein